MRRVVLVSADVADGVALARRAAGRGEAVTLVLLAGAARSARQGHPGAAALADALDDGITVLAHAEALARRASQDALADGVKPVGLDELADLLVDGADRAVWWS